MPCHLVDRARYLYIYPPFPSLKVSQVSDLALQMSTNEAPRFPQPSTSTGTVYPMHGAIGTPEQHSIGSAPGFTYPPERTFTQNFLCTFKSTANPLPLPNVAPRRPSAHDPPHQPIQVPPHTSYEMPQVPGPRMPSTTSSPPPVIEQRSGTMQMPDHRANIRPAPGPYSDYNSQAQGMSHSPSQRGGGMLGAAQNAPNVYINRASVPYS